MVSAMLGGCAVVSYAGCVVGSLRCPLARGLCCVAVDIWYQGLFLALDDVCRKIDLSCFWWQVFDVAWPWRLVQDLRWVLVFADLAGS